MLCLNNVPGVDERDARTIERFLEWLYAGDGYAICERERGGFIPLKRSHTIMQADEVQLLAEGFLAEECR